MKRFLHAVQVLVLGFVGTAFAAPFQNGSFEIGPADFNNCNQYIGVPSGSTVIPGWVVSAGNIDWVTPCNWTSSNGTHSLDLIGGTAVGTSIGGIQQTFDTVAGVAYQVSFDLAGNPSTLFPPAVKPLSVTVAGTTHDYSFDTTGKTYLAMGWVTHSFTFVATGPSSTINFVSNVGLLSFAGAALDNVSVTPIPSGWVGAAGSVTNQGTPIASSPTVLSNGTGITPAEFTYQTVNSYCCHTGAWTFENTAVVGGTVTLNWTYSGYHGTCQAVAQLTPYVRASGGGPTAFAPPIYNQSDALCNGALPAGGFGDGSQIVFVGLNPGDAYGFAMYATNFDSNGGVGGRLTLTTGSSPTTTVLQSSNNPAFAADPITFTATVTGSAPTGHVTFTQEGRVLQGCQAIPLVGNTAVCSLPSFFSNPNLRTILALYSGDSVNARSVSLPLIQNTSAVAAPAPTLVRVVTTNTGSFVIGRADGVLNSSVTFNAFAGSSCAGAPLVAGGPFTASTDAAGYFGMDIANINSGQLVSVQLTAPSASGMSGCLVSSGANDVWPKALGLFTTRSDYIDAPGKARWYKFSIAPGQKIQVTLSGSAADYDLVVFKDILKAFEKELTPPPDAAALTKLNAEFAPSTFSPSTFSPSTFSPSTFSPDAYSALALSPSTFSPSTFSPSTFSPSTFSPSTFSPSTFSPSTFSPSTFSPSTFSPSTFSPSTFSPALIFTLSDPTFNTDLVRQAFSSAQTRSIIGVSATAGTGNELVVANTWNETGDFYVRVGGRGDAFSTSGQFTLNLIKGLSTCTAVLPVPLPLVGPLPARPAAPAGFKTVILVDSTKTPLTTPVTGGTLATKLQNFANRTEVAGAIVDVGIDARVIAFKAQAAAHKDCPYATNLLAEEIKGIVDTYRPANTPGLRYVVIVGNDDAIPFFRYPDETLIGQESGYEPPVAPSTISDASLSNDFVLSQDAYGAKTRISMRAIEFPVPGLAVGRVLETPAEIAGMIDAYMLAPGGVVSSSSSLVTGYDFLADAANAVSAELNAGTGVAPQMLVTANGVAPADSFTATQLSAALFGSRHDVIFLAGHFSANSALAADFATSVLTSDLTSSATSFVNSIVFSAGCHAGYNIVDSDALQGVTNKLDWAQAFAQKRATLIAGTGYQYGDTDFIEYSERLYKNFARQLRAGASGPISVGEALVRAKLDYLAITPDIRGIHQKAVLEATVFGLPMLSVNMPAGRGVIFPTDGGVIALPLPESGNAGSIGLRTASLTVTPSVAALTLATTCLKNPPFDTGVAGVPAVPCPSGYTTASWLNGPDGVVSNPAEPVLPLHVANVTAKAPPDAPLNATLRGIGLIGGSYTDSVTTPFTGAPTTEIRGVHTSFSSPVFFPMRLWTTNYFAALAGMGGTRLLVTPAQHRAYDLAAGTSVLRKYTGLNLRLYYSDNTTLTAFSAAPTIIGATAVSSGGNATFKTRVVGDPAAAIHDVWVTYTDESAASPTWTSLPLTQCGTGAPAVCGGSTDTQQWMGQLPSAPANLKYIVQAVNGVGLVSLDDNLGAYYSYAGAAGAAAATTLALVPSQSTINYGETPSVTATLTAGSSPVSSAAVSISAGGTSATATTGSNGIGTTSLAKVAPGSYQIVASYAGSASYLPSTASSPLTVLPAPSVFVDDSMTVAPAAFLLAQVGGLPQPQRPLTQVLVTFIVSQNGVRNTFSVQTDVNGRAALPPTGLPLGTYSVTATFAGSELYLASSLLLGNLNVTTPCPLGEKTKVRWHYSANGSPGNWTSDKQINCTDGFVSIAATDGVLNLAPGTPLKVGYALQLPGNKTHFNALLLNGKAVFPVACVSGATPSQSSFTVTIPNQTLLLDSKSWNPSSNKDDPACYQGSGTVPDLCAGGQVRLNQGGSFSAFITLN